MPAKVLRPPYFLPDNYEPIPVSGNDLSIASICWGFTLGFGFLTTWEAIKQTNNARNPWTSTYVWLIWLEIFVCLSFSIICWLHLDGPIPGSFVFYFSILTLWALQVQFLLQIIINRISVILSNTRRALAIKWGTAALITTINITVYCIWIPARLQISEKYYHINEIWDRCEKIIYLLVDAILNWYFVKTVKRRLVQQGSAKYNKLVQFNVRIIFISLAMDCLIIGTMSLKNGFVYMQFHPLAYTVKLNIEMSMASLIRRIANEKNVMGGSGYELSGGTGNRNTVRAHAVSKPRQSIALGDGVTVQKEVIVESQSIEDHTSEHSGQRQQEDDNSPLRNETWSRVTYNANVSAAHDQC